MPPRHGEIQHLGGKDEGRTETHQRNFVARQGAIDPASGDGESAHRQGAGEGEGFSIEETIGDVHIILLR